MSKEFVWNKKLPIGASKTDYYNEFRTLLLKKLDESSKTFRISPTIAPVFYFFDGFVRKPMTNLEGDFELGEFDNTKVIVSPTLEDGAVEVLIDDVVIAKGKVICE